MLRPQPAARCDFEIIFEQPVMPVIGLAMMNLVKNKIGIILKLCECEFAEEPEKISFM